MKIVVTSGFYNPLHIGHLECFEKSKDLGDHHIAIVNSDLQVLLKGSKIFMDEKDRLKIIQSLKSVDEAILSIDKDITQKETLRKIRNLYPNNVIIFAKGGDRYIQEIPEYYICKELNIMIIDGLGKKIRASSEILQNI